MITTPAKKQNISSGFSVFLSVGHLGKRRRVTSEKRRRRRRRTTRRTPGFQQQNQKSKCFILCRLGARKPFFLSLRCTEFVPNSRAYSAVSFPTLYFVFYSF